MKNARRLFALSLLSAVTAHAAVRAARDNAFVIESTVSTTASPAATCAALGKVARWWNPEHTWSGAITMDARKLAPGGDQVMDDQLARLKA